MYWVPETLATDSTRWWQETYEHHCEALVQKIEACLAKTQETEEGCLELGSERAPAQIQWRGHKLRVYQLVAWGRAKDIPSRGVSCGTCATTVRVSTQNTCRSVHRRRTLRINGSSEHETQCSPPHIRNSLRCLTASASQYVGKPCKPWGNEALLPETAKTS
jgi:hypothetical protein